MRLFKCFDPYTIELPEQVIAVWAEDENEAIKKCAEIHNELDIYDEPFETVMKEWQVEEYFVPKECDVFICYPKDMTCHNDVRLVTVPFSVQDVESYVMDQLIELESQEKYFRNHVNDKGINMSFNEMFYCDDKGWIFSNSPPLDVREDIKEKAKAESKSLNKYIDDLWIDNIVKFFGDKLSYRNEYIAYVISDDEPSFSDEFYFYVCKRLMEIGQWVNYSDIRKVEVA